MINRALRLIRQFHERSQTDLAVDLAISKSYLCEIESGKKIVTLEILSKYSEIFDIPVSSLLFFSESLGNKNKVPEKFRAMFSIKILNIMEWMLERNGEKKITA